MNTYLDACNEVARQYRLTGAERYIVLLLAEGYKPKQIADIRGRSVETVRTQIKSVMQKMSHYRALDVTREVHQIAEQKSQAA